MVDDPNTYEPKYVDLDDIPISGPGSDPNESGSTTETSNVLNPTEVTSDAKYTDVEKRKALFTAEVRLEGDVNDGEEIDTVTNLHKVAVMNLATHVMTHGAEDPSSVALGDISRNGERVSNYSSRYADEYDELVNIIHRSNADDGGGTRNRTYTANSGK